MAKFKGKNSIKSTRKLASARVVYDRQAFPDDPPQVVDFNFAERTLYGRVDRSLTPVYPKAEFIVPNMVQSGEGPTVSLMNFVADQYYDFEAHFSRACRMGLLPNDDPIFTALQAQRGYLDPAELYANYSDELMGIYANSFLNKYKKDVNTFEDYLLYFPQYMEKMRDIFPVTYSGFQRSSQSSIFTSGLAVDIAGVSFANDEAKQQIILDSPAFEFYLGLAKQYGFSVNKRNPGVLISDLQSPATVPYRQKYNLVNISRIFALQYDKTLYRDIPELIELLVNGYNSFVSNNFLKRELISCNDGLRSNVYVRKYININNIYYNNIIETYIVIRNIEERRPFDNVRIKDIMKNALEMRKHSEIKMLNYIDAQFKDKYNKKSGSLTYYKKKLEKRLDK